MTEPPDIPEPATTRLPGTTPPEPVPSSEAAATPPAPPADEPPAASPPPPPPNPGAGPGPWGNPENAAYAAKYGLIRPINGRYFAGVCAAIARATSTDPMLWRIMLAVLTVFGGIGLVAYLIGWLLIPSEGDTASPLEALLGRGRSGTSPMLSAVVGASALLMLLYAMSDGFRTALLGVGVIVGVALLLSRREHGAPRPPRHPGPTPKTSAAETPWLADPTLVGARAPHGPFPPPPPGPVRGWPHPPQQPPWGAYPPPVPPMPPAPPAPRPPRQRSPLGRITMSVLCLVLGALVALDLTVGHVSASDYIAAALAVVGLGLLVGAWLGRARGLIALGLVLSAALASASAAEEIDPPHATGNQTWSPVAVDQLQTEYTNGFGNAYLDLKGVDFSNQDVKITISNEFGQFVVALPPNVDVNVDADVEFGNAEVFGQHWNGRGNNHRVNDTGPDGAGGGSLTITADVEFGNLEVHR